jgi:hypothetical protein
MARYLLDGWSSIPDMVMGLAPHPPFYSVITKAFIPDVNSAEL